MSVLKKLLFVAVIGVLFTGCQKGQQEQASLDEGTPAPLGANTAAEIPKDVDIGSTHTSPTEPTEIKAGDIAKAEGGYTVEDIYTKSAELSGKEVSIRAKVVKFNAGIMGSNWAHIQDGTGGAGTSDLTVTTQGVVNVGDTVLVTGVLTTDKDFGAGYKYSVIIENANITTE